MSGPFTYPVAVAVPFDGTEDSNGVPVVPVFVSENVRDGIIEARDTAVGLGRFIINLTYNGTINDNTFIGFLNTMPGDTTPIQLAVKSRITEFTFSNLKTNADYTLEFRVNSTVGAAFFSISKVNTQFFTDTTIDQVFNAGDRIYVKYKDDGNNAQDVGMMLSFKNEI